MSTRSRRSSVSSNNGGSGSGSDGDDRDFDGSLPFYSTYKGDAHTKLIEELRREKDILVRKLSKSSNPEEARKIRQELVHAGILDHDADDGDDGGNHALMLLQLTAFSSSSSPSSSPPVCSSPINPGTFANTPPLSSYATETYPYGGPSTIPSGTRATSPLSLNTCPSPSPSAPVPTMASAAVQPTAFGSLSSSANAFISASAASAGSALHGLKNEATFLTFNPIVTTVTSPHSVTTSTIIPSMTSSTCSSSDLLASKKKRQRTNPEQLQILEQIFETEKMPSQQVRQQLAEQLGMSTRRIQIWFQNKRAKVKRHPGSGSSLSSSGSILNKSLDDGSTDDEDDEVGSDGSGPSPLPVRAGSSQMHIHSATITSMSLTGRGGAQSGSMFVPRAAISI